MKKIYKLLLVTVVFTGALFQSCETTELEQIDNPNALTDGDANFFLNRIQTDYLSSQRIFSDRSSELTRIDYMNGRNYFDAYSNTVMNTPWADLYSDILPDLQQIEALETELLDLSFHIGVTKIMQADIMMQLVDFIGNIVPMDQATRPTEFPTPEVYTDDGALAYASALSILDEAIALLSSDPQTNGANDLFYGGDASKWVRLANTLKMRAAITTGDFASFDAIVNGGNFITDTADDFEFAYGTQLAPVNTQHQDYFNDYTTSGANIYQNTWLMKTMLDNSDPRVRYYFYRQSSCTPGATCMPEGNGEDLSCSLQGAPIHLQGTDCEEIWCYMEDGYWGRMHGNDEGTPPDNFKRTAVGVYPAAGKFDDDDFTGVSDFTTNPSAAGGNGAGIEPMVLASYVDFWRAERALAGNQPGAAAGFLQSGLEKHIAKVQSFIGLDPDADDSFAPSGAAVDIFVSGVVAQFSGASGQDQWDVLGEQYFATLFGGGGTNAHNFYRRTGAPSTVCPNIDPNPGNYPRTLLYPASEASTNPNITQRTTNDEAVFWNTQALPSSN